MKPISIFTILGIVFLVLKLTNHIAWPWIWVLSPFWIGILLWTFCFIVILAFGVYIDIQKIKKMSKRGRK